MTDLADFEAPERESFRVTDDSSAAWAMRKLHAARQVIAERTAAAVAEQERVKRWLASVTKQAQSDAEFFEGLLADYGRQRRVTDGTKSVVLPHGKIATRVKTESWAFTDEFIDWAQTNAPDLVRAKWSPDVKAAKAHLLPDEGVVVHQGTGECVPGVTVTVPADDDYTVTVTVDEDTQ